MIIGEANHLADLFNLCVPNIRMYIEMRYVEIYGLTRDVSIVLETLVDNLD